MRSAANAGTNKGPRAVNASAPIALRCPPVSTSLADHFYFHFTIPPFSYYSTMNGDGSDAFQKRTESFLNWLQRLPKSKFGSKIQLADLRDRSAGRGVGMLFPVPYLSSSPTTYDFHIPLSIH